MKLIIFLSLFALSILSFDLVKVDREIEKLGLHRNLITNITVIIENESETHCSLIF